MGQIVVIEGIDAVGKSTVANHLCKQMKEAGIDCVWISKKNPVFSKDTEKEVQEYAEILKRLVWAEKKNGIPLDFLTDVGWVFQMALWYVFVQENCIEQEREARYDYSGWLVL